jgi:hypothetical protein
MVNPAILLVIQKAKVKKRPAFLTKNDAVRPPPFLFY